MFIDLNTVLSFYRFVDTGNIFNINIENTAAILTAEMVVPMRVLIIPFQSIRQRNLADNSVIGKLAKIAVDGRFAY